MDSAGLMASHSFKRIIGLSFTLLVILFALTTILSAAPVPPIYWQSANGGLPYDIQALEATSTTLYAGTWGQGVYRSTDHGATWLTATAGLTLPMYISGGLAVNPVTPTTLFAGDYFGALSGVGIYRSLDGGASWTVSLRDTSVETLLVHPLSPTLVFAGTADRGLYRSADNGATWETALAAQRVQTLAAASAWLYAGAGNELHVSANGGLTWTLASTLSSTVTALAVHLVTPTYLYAGTRQHGLWRSVDGGASWLTDTVAGLPGNAWITSIAVDPISPTTLYAGVWQGNVYRSLDGGAAWEDLGYLGTVQDVLIHPIEPSVIYAATSSNGVFRGSTLDHLTVDEIASPQYVNYSFPLTLTARDALGFPLTGMTPAQLRAMRAQDARLAATLASGGYAGRATLTDITGALTPTAISLVDGIATVNVTIAAPHPADTITATLADGPVAVSQPFAVLHAPVTHITFAPIPDQIAGRPFTLTLTARDALDRLTFYTGTVVLSDTTGALAARHAGPFTAGAWSGQVTLTRPHPAVIITAADGAISGASHPFAVRQLIHLPVVLRD